MKKASAETIARVALHKGERICAGDLAAKLCAVDAARALHRVWLKGGIIRVTYDGMYYYKKKKPDVHTPVG